MEVMQEQVLPMHHRTTRAHPAIVQDILETTVAILTARTAATILILGMAQLQPTTPLIHRIIPTVLKQALQALRRISPHLLLLRH